MIEELFVSVTGISVLTVFAILIVGYFCAKFLGDLLKDVLKTQKNKFPLSQLDYSDIGVDFFIFIVKYSIYLVALILSLAQLGFSHIVLQTFFVAIIAILLFVFIYSLRDFIPNAAAGLYIFKTNIIDLDETIKVGIYEGKVKNIDLLSTTLLSKDGKVIIIPNGIITKEQITKVKQ